MHKTVMLIPVGLDVGLPTVSIGLRHTFATRGLQVALFQPIAPAAPMQTTPATFQAVMTIAELEQYLSDGAMDKAVELTLDAFEHLTGDICIVHGLMARQSGDYALAFNSALAQALNAHLIFVASPGHHSNLALSNRIELVAKQYQLAGCRDVLGCIVNKVHAPAHAIGNTQLPMSSDPNTIAPHEPFEITLPHIPLLASIPWEPALIAPRLCDMVPHIHASIIHRGEITQRRVHHMSLCARTVPNMVSALKPDTLIITAGDRSDIILAVAMAALNGTRLAGLLLTGGYPIDETIHALCQQAFQTGLPVLCVPTDSFRTCQNLQHITLHTPPDDTEKQKCIEDIMLPYLQGAWLDHYLAQAEVSVMNQAAFRHHLMQQAQADPQRIILPESEDPRVLRAGCHCHTQGIAHITFLGDVDKLRIQAEHVGIDLPDTIQVIDPEAVYRDYVDDLIALRAHKGMNASIAQEQLQEQPLVLATMMLQRGEVDGMVAGAINPTPNVLRPALQLIQTAPDAVKISSVFFMCFPNQVLVFGDCAVNPHPDVDTLADIAMQSAATAERFGIAPKVAMISYSTGDSAGGEEVERVKAATERVKAKKPALLIDGPLQYDAALIPSVAEKKAPNSPVAGQATVLIFPDLNTGNTTYKAVQRSANLLCIGPVLQGLNKPVNDLSRGATVDDMIYTIALTARQAQS